MKTLLHIEWLKIKNYAAFKILSFFFALGVFVTNYAVFAFNKNVLNKSGAAMVMSSFNPYSFSNTWQSTSYAAGFLLLLPAMLLIILVTNEYSFKTSRQNIIDGWSRSEFISVKLVLALIIAVASTVLVIIAASVFGLASGSEFSLNKFSHVGLFFLKAVTYNMFAVLVSVLVKKTGFAIGLYFIYLGAENFISQMLDFWSMKLKKDNKLDLGSMGDYLPMNAADGMLSFPDNPLKSLTRSAFPTDYFLGGFRTGHIFTSRCFIWLARKKFIRADL